MRPFIRDGALLTVEPVQAEELRSGDIVLYRSGDHVSAHRLLLMSKSETGAELIIGGDALSEPLERVSADQVLGRIIRVEQAGVTTAVDTRFRRLIGLIWAAARLPLSAALAPRRTARALGAKLVAAIQGLGFYRRFARRLIARRVRYRAAVADDAERICRLIGFRTDLTHDERAEEVRAWIRSRDGSCHVLVATFERDLAGAIVIDRLPEPVPSGPDWWISEFVVRIRYRGAGIGKGLIVKALHRIRNEAGARLGGQVRRTNRTAMAAGIDLHGREIDPGIYFDQFGRIKEDRPDSTTILYRSVDECLTLLETAGTLDEYRGTGCCNPD